MLLKLPSRRISETRQAGGVTNDDGRFPATCRRTVYSKTRILNVRCYPDSRRSLATLGLTR
jgi:hypothetical protein